MHTHIRIAWKYGILEGKGGLYPRDQFKALQLAVNTLNKQYGAGTYWIEYCPPPINELRK